MAAGFLLVIWPVANAQESGLAEAQRQVMQDPEEELRLLDQIKQDVADRRFAQAITLAQRVLAIREKAFGPEDLKTATALHILAGLYKATGAYAKAEPLLQRSLAISEKTFGPESSATVLALTDLAELYQAMGADAKAEPLLERVRALRAKAPESGQPDGGASAQPSR